MSQTFARIVFALTATFFAAFFIWPIFQILKGGFIDADGRLTFEFLGILLSDRTYLSGLANSFLLACASTTFALLIALPLAFMADRFRFPGKALLTSLILIPMILPPFVGAIGIKQIFGQYGALNAFLINLGLRPEPRLPTAEGDVQNHDSSHHRQSHRRWTAGLCLRDA